MEALLSILQCELRSAEEQMGGGGDGSRLPGSGGRGRRGTRSRRETLSRVDVKTMAALQGALISAQEAAARS